MTPEQLYKWVKDHADELREGAANNKQQAMTIIRLYQMLVARPEHIALGLLEEAVKEYRDSQP